MYKKIINPIAELNYRVDGIDNKYLINEGKRSLGMFAATQGIIVPSQITTGDLAFYILEGAMEIRLEDKIFTLKSGEMLLIPNSTAYSLNFTENAKIMTMRM